MLQHVAGATKKIESRTNNLGRIGPGPLGFHVPFLLNLVCVIFLMSFNAVVGFHAFFSELHRGYNLEFYAISFADVCGVHKWNGSQGLGFQFPGYLSPRVL